MKRLRGGGHLALLVLAACSGVRVSTPAELARFQAAGLVRPQVDWAALEEARLPKGPYRVAPGDVLEIEMPAVLQALSPEFLATPPPHHTRVTERGTITLPRVGEVAVAGKTLAEVEEIVVQAYHPRFLVHRPAVVARVLEPTTVKVTVVGAVPKPGIYGLASDERSLVGALMKAGGILTALGQNPWGAYAVRIRRNGRTSPPLVLPVEGLNIPFADVKLEGGETIEVVGLSPQTFTVVGLVEKPGTFPYPPGARLTLASALGQAGWLDLQSYPRYVQIFRADRGGEVVSAVFDLDEGGLTQAAAVELKPGDVVAVLDTPVTQVRRFLTSLFRGGIFFGATYNLGTRR